LAHELQTTSAPLDRETWLASVDPARRDEAEDLLELFTEATGFEPQLWRPTMVGFGRYAYRYDSGHSGESLATGFSPRKADLSIYIMPGYADFGGILARLGPHRLGKACLYIKRLDRVDKGVLRALIRAGLEDLAKHWPVHPV
jgi:Domain of unknown function (DU1801)